MDKFIQQISWGNRRLLSVVLLWKQYKGMCTLYDEDRKRFCLTSKFAVNRTKRLGNYATGIIMGSRTVTELHLKEYALNFTTHIYLISTSTRLKTWLILALLTQRGQCFFRKNHFLHNWQYTAVTLISFSLSFSVMNFSEHTREQPIRSVWTKCWKECPFCFLQVTKNTTQRNCQWTAYNVTGKDCQGGNDLHPAAHQVDVRLAGRAEQEGHVWPRCRADYAYLRLFCDEKGEHFITGLPRVIDKIL